MVHAYAFLNVQLSPDFNFGLYDLDWDVFSSHIKGAVHRIPCLEKTGIKSTVSGPGMCKVLELIQLVLAIIVVACHL